MTTSPVAETSKESSEALTISDGELEKLLHREASELNRELECERVLKAFKLKSVVLSPLSSYLSSCYSTLILITLQQPIRDPRHRRVDHRRPDQEALQAALAMCAVPLR